MVGIAHQYFYPLTKKTLKPMTTHKTPRLFFALFTCLFLFPLIQAQATERAVINEDFHSLAQWQPYSFPGKKRASSYKIVQQNGHSFLKTETRNSASAIICRTSFAVADFPVISWRWKVDTIYPKGDLRRKNGDDYPIRIYVMFQYEAGKASFLEKLQYESAKLLYGEYPPHSSLNYIWANRKQELTFAPNPYTSRAMMFPLDQGGDKVGQWISHRRNILEDYRLAFGKEPPQQATLAIMSDSDDTGSSATAYVDYIKVMQSR